MKAAAAIVSGSALFAAGFFANLAFPAALSIGMGSTFVSVLGLVLIVAGFLVTESA